MSHVPTVLKSDRSVFDKMLPVDDNAESNDNLLKHFLSLFIRCFVPGVVLIVSIHDICLLSYFLYSHKYRLARNTVYCAFLSDQIVVGCPLGVPISY